MKISIIVLLLFVFVINLNAQENECSIRLKLFTSLDNNLSSNELPIDEDMFYFFDFDKTNYRVGLNIEYELKNGIAFNSGINYSDKDFSRLFECYSCDYIVAPSPIRTKLNFIEFPIALRYYLHPQKLKVFGEVGVNNQFKISGDKPSGFSNNIYILGLKAGVGVEYNFNSNIAIQLFTEYNKGLTNLYRENNYQIDYLSFGFAIVKSLKND